MYKFINIQFTFLIKIWVKQLKLIITIFLKVVIYEVLYLIYICLNLRGLTLKSKLKKCFLKYV